MPEAAWIPPRNSAFFVERRLASLMGGRWHGSSHPGTLYRNRSKWRSGKSDPDRRTLMELLTRMMDGSISYDPQDRLGPVLCGSENQQVGKIDFEQIPILAGCSQKQLRSIARIARVLDGAAGTVLIRRGGPGDEFFLILDGKVR